MTSTAGNKAREGFTLVEMLVVISIIALLATMLIPAIRSAKLAARRGNTRVEIGHLEVAMLAYFSDWGVYPPDRTDGSLLLAPLERDLDAAQCLVYYLGTQFRTSAGFSRNGGPYFDFPPDRLDPAGRFLDALGGREGLVNFYRFDNNDDDGGDETWATSPWNVSNVHPNSVDIWSAGPDGIDLVCGLDAAGGVLPTSPVHPRRSSVASLEHGYDNDGDGKRDEDPIDGDDNDGDGAIDEDHPEDFIGNW